MSGNLEAIIDIRTDERDAALHRAKAGDMLRASLEPFRVSDYPGIIRATQQYDRQTGWPTGRTTEDSDHRAAWAAVAQLRRDGNVLCADALQAYLWRWLPVYDAARDETAAEHSQPYAVTPEELASMRKDLKCLRKKRREAVQAAQILA